MMLPRRKQQDKSQYGKASFRYWHNHGWSVQGLVTLHLTWVGIPAALRFA